KRRNLRKPRTRPLRQSRRNLLDAPHVRRHTAPFRGNSGFGGAAMRRFTVAAGVACAILLTSHAIAQFNSTSASSSTGTVGGTTMPGQMVSTYRGQVSQVGERAPSAAPQVGQSIAGSGMRRPYDPTRPYD